MSIVWKLARVATGEEKTLEEWQIRSAQLSLINQGADTLSLSFGGTDLLGNSPFNSAEILRLDRVVDDVATTVFRGRARPARRGAYGSTEGLSLLVEGPWWYLANTVYMQTDYFVTSPDANPAPTAPATTLAITDFERAAKSTSAILLREDQLGSIVDSREQIIDAIEYVIAKGAPIALGTIDDGIAMPRDSIQDTSCAEIISKSIRWTPDQAVFFDYSVDPPTINVRKKENRVAVEIDIADETVAEVEINPRDDLAVAGVTINYLRRHQRTDFEFVTLDKDQAGADPEGIGALVLTLELFGSYINQQLIAGVPTNVVIAAEDVPAGLAASLFAAYSDIPYEGRILLAQDECAALAWISKKLSILSGVPAWSAASMLVQQSVEDIFVGRTELTVGPPRQLGAQDLLGLIRKGRTKPPSIGDVLGGDGGTPRSPDVPQDAGDPRLQFPPSEQPDLVIHAWRWINSGGPGWYGYVGYDHVIVTATPGGPGHGFSADALSIGSVADHFGVRIGRGQDKYQGLTDPIPIHRDGEFPLNPNAYPSYRVLSYTAPITQLPRPVLYGADYHYCRLGGLDWLGPRPGVVELRAEKGRLLSALNRPIF
ncbi:MAG: hypothetical protein LC642_05365 [Verrucomicrobiaceae bacterium]|nr:hypothetical protein [Verrucomicrobiaceae bacterium]